MSDFAPKILDGTLQEKRRARVAVSPFDNGTENRRTKSPHPIQSFSFETIPYTKAEYKTAILGFYISKGGERDTFTFTNPNDDTEYSVRFDGELVPVNSASGLRIAAKITLKVVV